MKTTILLTIIVGFFLPETGVAQADKSYITDRIGTLLSRQYEHKLISSGQNFPAVNLQKKHRGDLAILLHEGIPLGLIRDHFDWSESDMKLRLDELIDAHLVKQVAPDKYLPTFLVMSLEGVVRHMPVSESLVEDATKLVLDHLPEVRKQYAEIDGFRHIAFEFASLLILSDVLLDNWQINAVEKQFLKAERPLRAGSQYYYSMQEKAPWSSTEAFGIYGNQYRGYGPYTVGVYGNRRSNNPHNFQTLNLENIENLFGTSPETVQDSKQEILRQLVEVAKGSGASLSSAYREGMEALGWEKDGDILVPILSKKDNAALSEMARLVTSDLLALLESYRTEIASTYELSPFALEVTFEEYFIWWYHLFYTDVTDRLIAQGYIVRPNSGISSYVLLVSN